MIALAVLWQAGTWLVDPRISNPATDTFSWAGGAWDQTSPTYARIPDATNENAVAGVNVYDAMFFAALCDAVESGRPGADAAWTRVMNGISNFSTWRTGFRKYPIYNRWPRNK